MTINDQLPRKLKQALRKIKNDDDFVGAMWDAFILYHDLRAMELCNPSMEVHRQNLEEVESALHQVTNKLRATGHDTELFKLMPHLEAARTSYRLAADAAAKSGDRVTKNRTLILFLQRVTEIFSVYGAPQHHIVGLIHKHFDLFAPDAELQTLPSESSIKRAKAAACKKGQ